MAAALAIASSAWAMPPLAPPAPTHIAPIAGVVAPSAWTRTGGGSSLSADGPNVTGETVVCSAAVAVGDLVMVAVTYGNGPGATSDIVTDDLGNGYTKIPGSAGTL